MSRKNRRAQNRAIAPQGTGNPTSSVVTARRLQIQGFSGPIPPPDVLQRYNEVIPGGAERIMKMAEEQAGHRRQIETRAVDHEISASKFGQRGALVVAVLGISAGSFIAWLGQTVAGTGVIGGTIGVISVAYVTGTLSRRSERKHKAQLMAGSPGDTDQLASRG